jgi:hypothetical protein
MADGRELLYIAAQCYNAIYVRHMKTILENPERFAHWDGVYTFDWK